MCKTLCELTHALLINQYNIKCCTDMHSMQSVSLMTCNLYTLIIELNYASLTGLSDNATQLIKITQNHRFSHNHIIAHNNPNGRISQIRRQ